MQFTPDQQAAVDADGTSVMVSAAAGSGKTAVLAARCAKLVADDPSCGVENLLVVTFTKAAARQMRERIGDSLRKRQAAEKDAASAARLNREVQLLPRASIGTLSSFCSTVLRQHFHAAGVDPSFAILDGDAAGLLKQTTAKDLFNDRYDPASDGAAAENFHRLIDLYAEGDDRGLIRSVIACHELLTSVADPAAWRADALRRAGEAAERPLAQTDFGRQIAAAAANDAAALEGPAKHAKAVVAAKFADNPKLAKLAAYTEDLLAEARARLKAAKAVKDGDAGELFRRVSGFVDPNLPGGAKLTWPGYEEARDAVNALRAALKTGEAAELLAMTAGDWQAGMRAVVGPTRLFLELVEAFGRRYAAAKAAIRSLDFADLERKTLELLTETDTGSPMGAAAGFEPDPRLPPRRPEALRPSEIARQYQNQFRHVLVDEVQDINEVQDRLLRLLSRESTGGGVRPNLFAVGDVKQSIYRFRLAEPGQFVLRLKEAEDPDLPHRRRIDLNTNFRSRGPLLDAVNAAFERLMSDAEVLEIDYADRHALRVNPGYEPAEPGGFSGGPVEVRVLTQRNVTASGSVAADEGDAEGSEGERQEAERIEREAAYVASRIREFKAEGRVVLGEGGEPEPFDLKHVAVLMRSFKRTSERFAGVLRRLGVACHSEVGTGFFASTEVRDVLSLLHVLDNRRQDIPLAALLRSPLVGLENAEDVMARIRLRNRGRDVPYFEAVLRYARREDAADAALVRGALDRVDRWRALAHRRPLAELLWTVYTDSGLLAYVAGLPDGEQRVANLLELHKRAGQFDTFQRQGLGAFMAFLRSLEDAGEVGQPPVVGPGENVVRAMSIHASKGLEFPVVFLCDCGKRHNLRDGDGHLLLGREHGVAMRAVDEAKRVRYPTLAHELARRDARRLSLAEELRVLYVAMTRAKEHLVCVGTATKDAAAEVAAWDAFADGQQLAARDVLKGGRFLDWLGMAAAGSPAFDVSVVEDTAVYESAEKVSGRAKPAAVDKRLIGLRPLPDAPPLTAEAARAVARITTPYHHPAVARLAAAVGVTSLGDDAALQLAGLKQRRPADAATTARTRLQRPRFVDADPTAADLGTATHVVLRHLDFRDAADAPAVRRQIEEMAARHQLDERLARRVDADALAWLAGTELGELLKRHHDALLRELPVRVPAGPETIDRGWTAACDGPLDRVLLRGQVDVVVPVADGVKSGLVLADYKTDRLDAGDEAAVRQTVEAYRPQLGRYAAAVAGLTNRPITGAYLVLLNARRLESVPTTG